MKHIINNLFVFGVLFIGLLGTSGCNSAKENKAPKYSFPRLMDYNLELIVPMTKRVLKTGEEITFILINNSEDQVQLLDWHVNEPDNLKIYYRPYREGIEEFDSADKEWHYQKPDIQKPVRYNPLILSSLNRVFISVHLKLIDKPGKYLIVGKLSSGMVEVQSPVMAIEVVK